MQATGIPWPLYMSSAYPALPALATLLTRSRPRGAARWILAWSLLITLQEGVGIALALNGLNNHWLTYAALPAETALVLWALAEWQTRDVARLTLRLAIPLAITVWGVLLAAVENTSTFSTAAEPLLSVLGMAAAAWTLVDRSMNEAEGGLAGQSWFWTCAGLCLYFGGNSTIGPLAALLGGDRTLVARAYVLWSVINVVAFLSIARGVTCQVHHRQSGASSSPVSSPSASSWSPSAPP
ncbi:MAG: hypothetical protein Q8Q85_04405 [Gemmatimonadales bacterium]|nr:hypothetical protein [Gemmatimonadales bacterium]